MGLKNDGHGAAIYQILPAADSVNGGKSKNWRNRAVCRHFPMGNVNRRKWISEFGTGISSKPSKWKKKKLPVKLPRGAGVGKKR